MRKRASRCSARTLAEQPVAQAMLGDMAAQHRCRGAAHRPRGMEARRAAARARRARRRWPRCSRPKPRSTSSTPRCSFTARSACATARRRAAVSRDPRAAHLRRGDRGAEADHRPRLLTVRDTSTMQTSMHKRSSAHVDTFARDHLPPRETGRTCSSTGPRFAYPAGSTARRRCSTTRSQRGWGDRIGDPRARRRRWTYARSHRARESLRARARRGPWARSGQPRAAARPEQPEMAACWFAVLKAGGDRGGDDAAAAREASSSRSSTRRGLRTRLCDARLHRRARGGSTGVSDARSRCCRFGEEDDGDRRVEARATSRRRSRTSRRPPTTPR